MSLYKLGKAKILKTRLNAYNSGNANDIEPLFIIEVNDIDNVEDCTKALLKKFKYRKYKEIYQADLDVLKMIIGLYDTLTDAIIQYYDKNDKK